MPIMRASSVRLSRDRHQVRASGVRARDHSEADRGAELVMAFGSFSGNRGSAPMAEINVVPMVDIMLVLLVIFIITAPLLTNAVKIDLPHASSAPNVTKADNIKLAIDADGQLSWDGDRKSTGLNSSP